MANWWDGAPLASTQTAPNAVKASPSGNWWDEAPLADSGGGVSTVPAQGDRPTRVIMDMGPQKPNRGAIDAAARGAAQGITMNFGDELRGLVEASGANPNDPASLSALMTGALKYFGGDNDAKKRYEDAVARERELNQTAEDQHPVASVAGNIAGAIALPIGAAANATSLPARIGSGALTGVAVGGASGVGEGVNANDRVSRGLSGAVIGGALGSAAPVAIEGIVRGARAISGPVRNSIRSISDVDGEAARRVAIAIDRDVRADPAASGRLTPQEFFGNANSGGPAAIIDLGGDTTRALGRSAANTSPEGRMALSKTIDGRFEGQNSRLTGWLNKNFNYPDAIGQKEALDSAASAVNKPAYAKAFSDGNKVVLWDDDLKQVAQAPEVQNAIRIALPQLRNWAVRDGFKPPVGAFEISNGQTALRKTKSGNEILPSLQYWDYIKRALNEMNTPTSRQFARILTDKLDTLVPSYNKARSGAAAFFGAQDALEAGQNFVGSKLANREALRAFSKFTPEERKLFQDGFVSRFVDSLNEVGDRRSILNKIAESPAAQERLRIALGKQKAQELETVLRVEGIMDLSRTAVQGNSTTARQLAELGLAGGTYGISTGGNVTNPSPSAIANAALVYGAARGKNKINENLSRKIAEMLASNDPSTLIRGAKIISGNQKLFDSLRAADAGIARVGSQQTALIPPPQFPAIGRADDQPDVPRPPTQ